MRDGHAIVFVGDMKCSVAFYGDVLGLPLRFASPGWAEFATESATLALHAGETANGALAPAGAVAAGSCCRGFNVPDLDPFHLRMVEQGAPCVAPPREAFGNRIAQYADPDGLVLSVSQGSTAPDLRASGTQE